MTSPKVGIVIPAYNAAQFIEECLLSALHQDYDNVHVYLIDDASTDGTADIVARIATAFPDRILWKTSPRNRGVGATRQEATEMALAGGCRYIAPLDADDLRFPDSVRNQVALLESDAEAGVCYGRTNVIHWNGKLCENPGWERYAVTVKGLPAGEVWDRLIAFGMLGRPSTIVIRDEAARACRYEDGFPYFEDLDYLAQIATLPRYSRFVPFDGIVGSYRFHANQACSHLSQKQLSGLRYRTMQTVALRVFHRLDEQGRGVPVRKRRRLWRLLVLRVLARAVQSRDWGSVASLTKDLARPIARLEVRYKELKRSGNLSELLGVWCPQACSET